MSMIQSSQAAKSNKAPRALFSRVFIKYQGDKAAELNEQWILDRPAFHHTIKADAQELVMIQPAISNLVWYKNHTCILQWAFTGVHNLPHKALAAKVELIKDTQQTIKEELSIAAVTISVGSKMYTAGARPIPLQQRILYPAPSLFNPTAYHDHDHDSETEETLPAVLQNPGDRYPSPESSVADADMGDEDDMDDQSSTVDVPEGVIHLGMISPIPMQTTEAPPPRRRAATHAELLAEYKRRTFELTASRQEVASLQAVVDKGENAWNKLQAEYRALLEDRNTHELHHRTHAARVAELDQVLLEMKSKGGIAHAGISLEDHNHEIANLRQAKDAAKAEAAQALKRETHKSNTDAAQIAALEKTVAQLEQKIQDTLDLEVGFMTTLGEKDSALQRVREVEVRQAELEASTAQFAPRVARANLRCAVLQWLNQRHETRARELQNNLNDAAAYVVERDAAVTSAHHAVATLETTLREREASFAEAQAAQATLSKLLDTSRADHQLTEQRAVDAELLVGSLREELGKMIKTRDQSDAQILALEAELEQAQADLLAASAASAGESMDIDLDQAKAQLDENRTFAGQLAKAYTSEMARANVEKQKRLQAEESLRLLQGTQSLLLIPGLLGAAGLVERACRDAP